MKMQNKQSDKSDVNSLDRNFNEAKIESDSSSLSRRTFLKTAGSAGALTAAATLGMGGILAAPSEAEASLLLSKKQAKHRRNLAYRIRRNAALTQYRERSSSQTSNGDEALYADKRASFSKCLSHNELGEVDPAAFTALLHALESGSPDEFEAIPLSSLSDRKLANPQAACAFDMTGIDSHATTSFPAPAFASAVAATEMNEVYWLALARDIPFQYYEMNELIASAVSDLNSLSATVGPKIDGLITTKTLFRGETRGDLIGPYISQFLWLEVPYGPSKIVQKYFSSLTGTDFMLDYEEWLAVQRGANPNAEITIENTARYLHNLRALGEYVHKDVVFQAFFNAALIINSFGPEALMPENPYLRSGNQDGSITFGAVHLFDLVAKAARISLESGWFHKWLVHRRLRPEVFAARVENQLNGSKHYGIHSDVLYSEAVDRLFEMNGNRLLPQAYPEGSPTHPSYPAGHAVLSGACATILKAFFNEDFIISNPVEASADGLTLEDWGGDELRLGNEINKLANNISVGRCGAGIHYRSDGAGLTIGEAQALGLLRDYSQTYNENFDGFTLIKFDGQRVQVVDGEIFLI